MSNVQGVSYLTKLLEQANKIRATEVTRTEQLAAATRKAASKVNLRKQQNIVPTAIRPRQTSYLEQTTQNRPVTTTGISDIYKVAKEYNPLATTLSEAKLKEPLTYLSSLKQDTISSLQSQLKEQQGVVGFLNKVKAEQLKNTFNNKTVESYANTELGKKYLKKAGSGSYTYYTYNLAGVNNEQEKLNRLETVNKDILAPQQTTLSNLIAEQEKYFGKNFANVSKEQLATADWTSWQKLSGDITKYTSLRDTYINKFKADPSKYNKDWIDQYNKLITDTATSMTAEIPKVLQSATTAAQSIRQTQQSTLSTLEALDKSFGTQARIPSEQRKVMDVSSGESRQQALARAQRVGSFTQGVKPTPKFEARPY